ncbi:hypothetical protein KCMC57_up30880 [Kitasatospora sp. CMC57]|uniref:RES domain-containing protein n=1 Tax=Kitasatospora sp. CMC57 TaxID=3231513 RepID=A0AB33K499_9ACTN
MLRRTDDLSDARYAFGTTRGTGNADAALRCGWWYLGSTESVAGALRVVRYRGTDTCAILPDSRPGITQRPAGWDGTVYGEVYGRDGFSPR